MSAADRLRALDKRRNDLRFHPLNREDAERQIVGTIPALIAVVEAAEKRRPDGTFYAQDIAAALAALAAALGGEQE